MLQVGATGIQEEEEEEVKRKVHFGEVGMSGRIILKFILKYRVKRYGVDAAGSR
jgi:hypothetical protein